MATKAGTAATLYKMMTILADEMDVEMPLTQVLVFARVAVAGDAGIDQGRVQDELRMSSASASRTVQALSKVHYFKDRPGFDVVERVFDPKDNRKRTLKLTPKGEKLMARVQVLL